MKVKNIVFSGFMAAILGATGAHAAISVASQGYVDSKISGVETSISNVAGDVTSIQTSLNEGGAIASDIAAAQAAANKAQGEVDALETVVATKANAADVYSKTEADAKFEEQAAATQKLKDAKDYTDTQIKTLTESLGGVGEDGESTGLTGTVAAQGVRITALEDKVGTTPVADQIANALTEAKGYTDTEVAKVDAKFANYTTTEDLTKTLEGYATDAELAAEATAREAVDAKLADYTKTTDLDAGFVSETEMTAFKSSNDTAIADAKKAGTDAAATAAENAADIAQLQTDLTTKITMPEVCATTNCVLSTIGGTVQWVPLTDPLDSTSAN